MKTARWMTGVLTVFLMTAWGQIAHAELVDNGNGTVTDTATGLMWQQDTARDSESNYNTMIWEGNPGLL